MRGLTFTFLIFLFSISANAQLVVNEIMAKNDTTILDPDFNDKADWVEIYNTGADTVDIFNYFLSDDITNPFKWQVEIEHKIAPNEYAIIWCDDMDTLLHANFKLSTDGENMVLSNADSILLDSVTFGVQEEDISFGRIPNGIGAWTYLNSASPGAANDSSGVVLEEANAPILSHESGFYNDGFDLEIFADSNTVIRYTLDNTEPTDTSPIYTSTISVVDRNNEQNNYSKIRTTSVKRWPPWLDVFPWIPEFQVPNGKVDKATVVRARVFEEGKSPSKVVTKTFFVENNIATKYETIPVLSIVTDPDNLFDYHEGIYVPGITYDTLRVEGLKLNGPGNYLLEDLKKPANIEFFENSMSSAAFSADVTIWTQGSTSPANPQKALHIKAVGDDIEYPLFAGRGYRASERVNFDRFILRAWGSKADADLISDPAAQALLKHTEQNIQAYRPVVVFIDGEYWGIQEIRENNKTASYFKEYFDVDEADLTMIHGSKNDEEVKYGDSLDWHDLTVFLDNEDMSTPEAYDSVKSLIDMPNFIEYMSHIIYATKKDWPYQNEGKWKAEGGKWQWLQFDMDKAFGFDGGPTYDMISHAINGYGNELPHPVYRRLINNQTFIDEQTTSLCDLMNTVLQTSFIDQTRHEIVDEMMPYFNDNKDRWRYTSNWQSQLSNIENFSYPLRKENVRLHIEDHFGYDIIHNIELDVSHTTGGYIQVNSIPLQEGYPSLSDTIYPWVGEYYENLPVQLTANAYTAYSFIGWKNSEGAIFSTEESISVDLTSDSTFIAVFEVNVVEVTGVYINEVLASNTNDTTDESGEHEDWIELYNDSDTLVNLSGLYLTDDRDDLTQWKIPGDESDSSLIQLNGKGFTFFWADDDTDDGDYHTNFKLGAGGEFVALVQLIGTDTIIIDSLTYPALETDISYGRYEDGTSNFETFFITTPGASNVLGEMPTLVTNLHINEFMADNDTIIKDEFDEYDDWIEIYNSIDDTLSLAGLYITDDLSNPTKWKFPNDENGALSILPGGFLLLWADESPEQGANHVGFKLGAGGEQIGLVQIFEGDTIFIDSLTYGAQSTDTSFGCYPDGSELYEFFTQTPTPNASNVPDSVTVGVFENTFGLVDVFPNPTKGFINMQIENVSDIQRVSVLDLTGKELIVKSNIETNMLFDLQRFPSGIYLISIRHKNGNVANSKVVKF